MGGHAKSGSFNVYNQDIRPLVRPTYKQEMRAIAIYRPIQPMTVCHRADIVNLMLKIA
jgi:hypothetical protein